MKLASLLEQHHQFATAQGALKNSFGDGFLISKNRIYKSIRTQALNAGFGFSAAQNDAYRVLPLSQLDLILKSQIIPYFDNVSVLESLEKKIPRSTLWDDISDNLKGNSVFHEACHTVARGFVTDASAGLAQNLLRETKIDLLQAQTLAMLLEESFANACELLSVIDAEDQVHRIFIELNSYVFMLSDRVHLRNASTLLGPQPLLRFMLLSYLHANFLRDFTEQSFLRVLNLATHGQTPTDPKDLKSLRQLSKIAFQLNPRFREVTTRFYLRLSGVNVDVARMQNFDFLKVLETSKAAAAFLAAAAKVF